MEEAAALWGMYGLSVEMVRTDSDRDTPDLFLNCLTWPKCTAETFRDCGMPSDVIQSSAAIKRDTTVIMLGHHQTDLV